METDANAEIKVKTKRKFKRKGISIATSSYSQHSKSLKKMTEKKEMPTKLDKIVV